MDRWSNCRFKATEHRVILQPGIEHYALLFLFGADYDALIECCVDDEPPKFQPITGGHYYEECESSHETKDA